jgi:hypothetical protein
LGHLDVLVHGVRLRLRKRWSELTRFDSMRAPMSAGVVLRGVDNSPSLLQTPP